MTLFTSKVSANLAAAKAQRAGQCAGCKVVWACCVCADRSMNQGFKVTLLNKFGHPIGCL